jgi:hypothetical protein
MRAARWRPVAYKQLQVKEFRSMEPITSGIQGTAVTPVKLNGVHKTIAGPVTGVALHALAGFPDRLTAGGKVVEKTNEPFKVDGTVELIADYGEGHGLDTPHAVESKKQDLPAHPAPVVSPVTSAIASPPPGNPTEK